MGNSKLGKKKKQEKESVLFFFFFLLPSSFFLLPSSLSWYEFAGPQCSPFAGLLLETFTADYIPFHFNFVLAGADVDVDCGFYGVEIGCFGEMNLFVLSFYGVVGEAAVYIMAVNTNTHP